MHEDTLAHVDLFSSLDKKELRLIGNSCQERKFASGSVLMQQGDTGAGLFVITSGRVKITQAVDPDRAEEDLGTAGSGAVLGEMALLDDLPRSATITAIEDVTALILPIWDFRSSLRSNPDIALKLLSTMSHRLRRAEIGSRHRD
ncbi:MAG TPA: cyclic nucleotide-binding domain-containing protein [Ktedonobacteraceae bacterium]|nr:cyclic nucleotide-binding domain-containing protein [Ktedonobacteraceae bacterium]